MKPVELIKAYRQMHDLNQVQAARAWGLHQSTIQKIEKGLRTIGPKAAKAIEIGTGKQLTRQMLRPDIFA